MAARGDVLGVGRLAVDAILELTAVVESMHGTIARAPFPVGGMPENRTRGLTRLVYLSIRGITGLVGGGIDAARAIAGDDPGEPVASPRRDAIVSVVNGVIGDHLTATNNPLAMSMTLHRSQAVPTGRILLLVHGSCMNYQQWKRRGHDHGEVLAATRAMTPVYASYNSGLHISANGNELANHLEALVDTWPTPITDLVILGHSMGGLVARSACEYARRSNKRWLSRLSHLVFVGTPHHGAPLERAGNLAEMVLALSPYAAPIARMGGVRSPGITDLRFGNLVDEDWAEIAPNHRDDPRTPIPLPEHVAVFAIAGAKDRMVPTASALGTHDEPRFDLAIPEHRRRVVDAGHVDLLDSREVADQLVAWL